MDKPRIVTLQPTEFLLYKDANGQVKVEIYVFDVTTWKNAPKGQIRKIRNIALSFSV